MSGMGIIAQEVNKPNSTELELLQTLKLAPRFQSGYSLEELGAKNLHLVARKGNSIL
jgi:hypothetical protein